MPSRCALRAAISCDATNCRSINVRWENDNGAGPELFELFINKSTQIDIFDHIRFTTIVPATEFQLKINMRWWCALGAHREPNLHVINIEHNRCFYIYVYWIRCPGKACAPSEHWAWDENAKQFRIHPFFPSIDRMYRTIAPLAQLSAKQNEHKMTCDFCFQQFEISFHWFEFMRCICFDWLTYRHPTRSVRFAGRTGCTSVSYWKSNLRSDKIALPSLLRCYSYSYKF